MWTHCEFQRHNGDLSGREGRDGKCEGRNEKCEFLARESVNSSPILHMQISAPFCFDRGRHLERSFAAPKLLAGHSVCLWRYGPISMWRWIIFFIFVDVWPFLSLARVLCAYNVNTWSLCDGKNRLKQIRGLSALQTSMVLPTLLLSAVQRRIERWRKRWRSIRTSCLPPEAESG